MNIVSLITPQHCNHLSPDGPVDGGHLLVDVVVLCRLQCTTGLWRGFNLI